MEPSKVSQLMPKIEAPQAVEPQKVITDYAECDKHGTWAMTVMVDGVTRSYGSCPRCKAEDGAKRMIDRAAIPVRFQDRTLGSYKATTSGQKNALKFAAEYAADFDSVAKDGRCLTLVGNPGTGKTHLACGVAHEVMRMGYTALFITVSDVIRAIRSTWNNKEKSEEEVLRNFTKVDLLILDEVGAQHGTDSEQITLFEIINRRYSNARPIIVLSNLPAQSDDPKVPTLKTYLGERAFDRLREGGGRLVVCDWPSYRRQA